MRSLMSSKKFEKQQMSRMAFVLFSAFASFDGHKKEQTFTPLISSCLLPPFFV
jgi:hypothetical protein